MCFSLYMCNYLVSDLLIPSPPLSYSLYFSLFAFNLISPFYSYIFLTRSLSVCLFSLSHSILIFSLGTSQFTLSLFLSYFQFFFLAFYLIPSLSPAPPKYSSLWVNDSLHMRFPLNSSCSLPLFKYLFLSFSFSSL